MPFKDEKKTRDYFRKYYLKNKKRLQAVARAWRKKNSKKIHEANKKRYWANREFDLSQSKKYYRDHKEERKEYNHEYYLKNKKKVCSGIKKWQEKNFDYYRNLCRLREMKRRCSKKSHKSFKYYGGKGIKCLMTLEDLIILWKRDSAEKMKAPTIDRIDSNGNYEISNCRFIENSENVRLSHG